MTIQERIIQVIENKNITAYRFCKDLGLSMGYLDKRGAIGTDKYLKIIEYLPEINPIWLLTGQGSRLKETSQSSISSSQPQENDNEVVALLKENNATLKDQLRDKERILTFQEERIKNLEQEILNLKKQTKSPSPASFMAKKSL